MYTEVGQGPGGSILARDNATGETIPILPANAAAMRAYGTLTGGPQSGPQMSMAPSPAGAFTGAPSTLPTGPRPPAAPAPAQPRPPMGGRAAGVGNAPLLQNQRVAPSMPPKPASPMGQPQGSPQLQGVRRPQGQPQTQVPAPQYETRYVPGRKAGYVPHSRTTAGLAKEEQASLLEDNQDIAATRREGLDVAYEAKRLNYEADREKAREDAANFRIDADLAEMRAKDIQTKNKKIEEGLNSEWDALTATKVDRDRVWEDKGWAAGLLAAVGIALNEYGSKMNGGPNSAMAMVENMIDRDIESQRQDLATRREGLDRKQKHYDKNIYGTEAKDLDEAKMLRWQAVQREAEERAADKELKMLHPQLLELAAMAGEKTMQAKAEILNMRKIQETEAYDRGSPGGYVTAETAASKLQGRALEEGAKRAKNVGEIQKVTNGTASDPDTVWYDGQPVGKSANAKDINKQLAELGNARALVAEMKDKIRNGSNFLDSDEYRSMATQLGYSLYEASTGSPVRSDSDAKAAMDLIGGDTMSYVRPEHQAKFLDSVVRRAERGTASNLSQRGINIDISTQYSEEE